MKIAVIGAAGKAGSLIVKEAISRGHDVTAIVRDRSKMTGLKAKALEKDLFSLTYEDIKDIDAIINVFGAWTPEALEQHQTSLKYLADLLSGKPNRLLVSIPTSFPARIAIGNPALLLWLTLEQSDRIFPRFAPCMRLSPHTALGNMR